MVPNHRNYREITKKCFLEPDRASIRQDSLVAVQTVFSELYNDIRESWIVVEFLLSLTMLEYVSEAMSARRPTLR